MSLPTSAELDAYIGRERTTTDVVTETRARALAATLDRDPGGLANGGALPPGWHWIFFNPAVPRGALGPDGHEERGDFLPALPRSRRMWAGGTLRFPGTLRIGDEAERLSTITSIVPKEGRSGSLVFVTVSHRVTTGAGTVLEEEQNLVYRLEGSGGGGADAVPPQGRSERSEGSGRSERSERSQRSVRSEQVPRVPAWTEPFTADEVTLFRFSALTFNGHRIHYDHRYATEVERYPGLVVHGPLVALLLLDAGVRHSAHRFGGGAFGRAVEAGSVFESGVPPKVSSFRYRALAPLFCNEEFRLCGGEAGASAAPVVSSEAGSALDVTRLWAAHPERGVATEAEIEVHRRGQD
jgi:3-methylfumaryl-CoA hydratase